MDLNTAKNLKQGQEVYHVSEKNQDGTPKRYKITSIKTWKRTPSAIEVRAKRGLYEFVIIDQDHICFITDEEPSNG